jgi:hypothetical protein
VLRAWKGSGGFGLAVLCYLSSVSLASKSLPEFCCVYKILAIVDPIRLASS